MAARFAVFTEEEDDPIVQRERMLTDEEVLNRAFHGSIRRAGDAVSLPRAADFVHDRHGVGPGTGMWEWVRSVWRPACQHGLAHDAAVAELQRMDARLPSTAARQVFYATALLVAVEPAHVGREEAMAAAQALQACGGSLLTRGWRRCPDRQHDDDNLWDAVSPWYALTGLRTHLDAAAVCLPDLISVCPLPPTVDSSVPAPGDATDDRVPHAAAEAAYAGCMQLMRRIESLTADDLADAEALRDRYAQLWGWAARFIVAHARFRGLTYMTLFALAPPHPGSARYRRLLQDGEAVRFALRHAETASWRERLDPAVLDRLLRDLLAAEVGTAALVLIAEACEPGVRPPQRLVHLLRYAWDHWGFNEPLATVSMAVDDMATHPRRRADDIDIFPPPVWEAGVADMLRDAEARHQAAVAAGREGLPRAYKLAVWRATVAAARRQYDDSLEGAPTHVPAAWDRDGPLVRMWAAYVGKPAVERELQALRPVAKAAAPTASRPDATAVLSTPKRRLLRQMR